MFSKNVVILNYFFIIIVILDENHAQREKGHGGLFVRNHPDLYKHLIRKQRSMVKLSFIRIHISISKPAVVLICVWSHR